MRKEQQKKEEVCRFHIPIRKAKKCARIANAATSPTIHSVTTAVTTSASSALIATPFSSPLGLRSFPSNTDAPRATKPSPSSIFASSLLPPPEKAAFLCIVKSERVGCSN